MNEEDKDKTVEHTGFIEGGNWYREGEDGEMVDMPEGYDPSLAVPGMPPNMSPQEAARWVIQQLKNVSVALEELTRIGRITTARIKRLESALSEAGIEIGEEEPCEP